MIRRLPRKVREKFSLDKFHKKFIMLWLPAAFQLALEPILGIINTFYVGHLGKDCLAALSISVSLINTIAGCFWVFGMLTTTQIANSMGRNDRKGGISAVATTIYIAMAGGIIMSFLIYYNGGFMAHILGANDAVLANAELYLRGAAPGLVFLIITYALVGVFRGQLKMKEQTIVTVVAVFAQLICASFFVNKLQWGIYGAGFATSCTAFVFFAPMFVLYILENVQVKANIRPRLSNFVKAVRGAVPLIIRVICTWISYLLIVRLYALLGEDALATSQVTDTLWGFAMLIFESMGVVSQALSSEAIGEKNYEKLERLKKRILRFAMQIAIIMIFVFILVTVPACEFITTDPVIVNWSIVGCVETALTLPLFGWLFAADGFFMGACEFNFLSLSTVVSSTISTVSAHIAVMFMGNDLISFVLLVAIYDVVFFGLRIIFNIVRFKSVKWKTYDFDTERVLA